MREVVLWSSRLILCAILCTGVLAIAVNAQTVSGTLRGTITDSNGAAVPNATVTARSTKPASSGR